MTQPYIYIENLASMLPEVPSDSIISRTFFEDEQLKAILFGFAPNQELSEHTAAKPAMLYFVEGTATIKLGEDETTAGPGTWVHMQPHLPHSIHAQTSLVMLLILL